MSTEVRIALVYQQAGGSDALRAALANAGVVVAAEARADALDAATLVAGDVDAVVVNLDAELEDLLDEVMERLDGLSQPVIYNDPEASSDLSGWDRARWLRHLSAKVKGGGSLVPPPPPGAEAVPMPAARPAPPGPAALASEVTAPETGGSEPAPEPVVQLAAEPMADLDLLLVGTAESQVSVSVATEASSEPMVDLDALFDTPVSVDVADPVPAPSAEPPAPAAAEEADFDALFMAATEPVEPEPSGLALSELDALFAEDPKEAPPGPPVSERSAEIDSEIDLTALLADFSLDQAPSGGAGAQPAPAAPEWTLEDQGTPSVAAVEPELSQEPATVQPPGEGDETALSELGDLDALFAEPAATEASTPRAPSGDESELATLDLGGIELELEPLEVQAPADQDNGAVKTSADESLAVADFDFGFDLEPMTAEAPSAPAGATSDPLDALFAAPTSSVGAAAEISLPDLDRLFVLGGSIGGPEAMKAFLARLPAGVPAAFVIAQHMGAEFLQMMAAQLDAASPLSVRFPKAGERLRHGEVVVAPSDQRLRLDAGGHIELNATTGDSPYSPSIDQLVIDAIERMGDRVTLVLFSGMGSDALEGARQLIARGGQVWVQERASCVVASMIDGVKGQGLVRFEGSPTQLAERVLEVLS